MPAEWLTRVHSGIGVFESVRSPQAGTGLPLDRGGSGGLRLTFSLSPGNPRWAALETGVNAYVCMPAQLYRFRRMAKGSGRQCG